MLQYSCNICLQTDRKGIDTVIVHYNEKLDAKIRVFISSTFRDMQDERNAIVGSVFPLLRRKYKHKSVDITEVDLRWGITEKDIEKLALLEICIAETLNCVPFFIGLIGDNYGTLAKLEEIKKLPPSYKRAIGMKSREDFPEGVSLTELEMRAGAFTKENRDYARFFIREPKNSIPDELCRLKARIVEENYKYATYKSTAELESKVYNSLENLIESTLPDEPPAPYGDRHYVSHLRLLKKSNLSYAPNDSFIEKVESVIDNSRCVYLHGEKGSGKTSAMSYLISREGADRDGDVFFHFTDADEESQTFDNLCHRLRKYIESVTDISSNDASDYNAILEILKTAGIDKRIVLYFDAVEKYNDASILSKLFAFGRVNSKVFVVCSGAKSYNNIPAEQLEIAKLDNEQIRQITVRSLRNYGKKLDESHMLGIFENSCCRNPLYLNALLNQLIAYGNHESFEEFFERLIKSQSFSELFGITVERLVAHFEEKGFDGDKIYRAMALMLYSNMGIRETELGEIIGMLPIERSIFLASVEIFITENDTLIRFNHDLISAAAKNILLEYDKNIEAYARKSFVEYFESEERRDGQRAFSEAPYQYSRLKLDACLLDKVSNVDAFYYLAKNQYNNLVGYLVSLLDKSEELMTVLVPKIQTGYSVIASDIFCRSGHFTAAITTVLRAVLKDSCLSIYSEDAPDTIADAIISSPYSVEDKVRLFATFARAYYKLAILKYTSAERAYLRAIEYYKSVFPEDKVGLASQSYLLGVTYKSMGDMVRAEELLGFAAEAFDESGVKNDISSWIYAVYGNIRFVNGDIKTAKNYLRRSVGDNAFLFGEDSAEIAWSYSYAWAVYYANGEKNTAFSQAEAAFKIYSELYGSKGAKIAWAATNYGIAAHIRGNLDKAKECYELSIAENNALVQKSEAPHVYSLTAYSNLALLEFERGNTEEAIRLIEFARENSAKKNGEYHLYTANMLLNEGIIKNSPETVRKAVEIYEKHGTPDRFFAKNCYARVLLLYGEEEMAEEVIDALYEEYLSSGVSLEIITHLINESLEKISFSVDEAEIREIKEKLARFGEYEYYISLNNSSAMIIIPEI